LPGLFSYIGEREYKNGGFRSKITKLVRGRYVPNAMRKNYKVSKS